MHFSDHFRRSQVESCAVRVRFTTFEGECWANWCDQLGVKAIEHVVSFL